MDQRVSFNNVYEEVDFEDCSSEKANNISLKPTDSHRKCCLANKKNFLIILLVILILIMFGMFLQRHFDTKSELKSEFLQQSNKTTCVDQELVRKRDFIKRMFLDSWNAYVKYAWGHEALAPKSKSSYTNIIGPEPGMTIVAAMSTMWIMELKDEFQRGKEWIDTSLNLTKIDKTVLIFDAITFYVGGLLSCYSLTNDSMFLKCAEDIARQVEPAFNTSTSIPYQNINLKHGTVGDANPSLSYMSGFQVDYNFLSVALNDSRYRNKIHNILTSLREKNKSNLYSTWININGNSATPNFNLFRGELFFNLVNSFIQSGRKNVLPIEMYKQTLDALYSAKIFEISPAGLYYARNFNNKSEIFSNYMQSSGCYLGAMLTLGAEAMNRSFTESKSQSHYTQTSNEMFRIMQHRQLAEKLTETCHKASIRTRTHLAPDIFYFNSTHEAANSGGGYYLTRFELAYSYFILWRLTNNQIYREWACDLAQSIHEHCRYETGGYGSIVNVDQVPAPKNDYQYPEFLSATLKYLYLTFSDNSLLPLDKWIFNAKGHPLPICGTHPSYPKNQCI